RAADGEDRECVPDTPEHSGPRGAADRALTAHDRGDGDDVVRIGRVTHPEEEAEKQDGPERGHASYVTRSAPPRPSGGNLLARNAHDRAETESLVRAWADVSSPAAARTRGGRRRDAAGGGGARKTLLQLLESPRPVLSEKPGEGAVGEQASSG